MKVYDSHSDIFYNLAFRKENDPFGKYHLDDLKKGHIVGGIWVVYSDADFDVKIVGTDNGTVSRGVCEVSEDGFLKSVTEHTAIDKNSGIPLDTTVSMNMWGLRPEIFSRVEADFIKFH